MMTGMEELMHPLEERVKKIRSSSRYFCITALGNGRSPEHCVGTKPAPIP
jgi:hypothetical protein